MFISHFKILHNCVFICRSVSLSPADSGNIAGWKRPWLSQVSTIAIFKKIKCTNLRVLNSPSNV